MFSYTDDAIVSSSPTGRHLSTVIKRPTVLVSGAWTAHAEEVCKVLNERQPAHSIADLIDRGYLTDYCWPLSAGILRSTTCGNSGGFEYVEARAQEAFKAAVEWPFLRPAKPDPLAEQIKEVRRELDDATTKLCAAQMLLEKPVEVTGPELREMLRAGPGTTFVPRDPNRRIFKRV